MNIASTISRVKKAIGFPVEQKVYSINSPEFAELLNYAPTSSGVHIGGESALNVPAVLQAVRLICETIGSLPVKLYRETPNGKEEATDHPAYRIVHDRANGQQSAAKFRELVTKDALLHGNAYGHVSRLEDDQPFELFRVKPGCMQVQEDVYSDWRFYRLTDARGQRPISYLDVLHISTFDGVSPITRGREAIGLASILERDGAKFFASGRKPAAVLYSDEPAGSEAGTNAFINVLKSYRKWRDGNSNDPLILNKYKFEQQTMTSTDAEYTQNRVFQIDEIARVFGVPPSLLFELSRATWSNAEQMADSFLRFCLRPWLTRWEAAYAQCLLSEDERDGQGYVFEFIVDDLLRADSATRAEVASKLIAARAITPNEVRDTMNFPHLPDGDDLVNPHTLTNNNAMPSQAPTKESEQ